jgi:hypothetical protein
VLHHGVYCGELTVSISVSCGKSVSSGIINHKQTLARSVKHAPRERGLSIVTTGLPKTVKLLIASLEKTSVQLLIKYGKKQAQEPSLADVAKSGLRPVQGINEIDLFLDSLR